MSFVGYLGFSHSTNPFPLLRALKSAESGLGRLFGSKTLQRDADGFGQLLDSAAAYKEKSWGISNTANAALAGTNANTLGQAKKVLKGMNNGLALSIIATLGVILAAALSNIRSCRAAMVPITYIFGAAAITGLAIFAINYYRSGKLLNEIASQA